MDFFTQLDRYLSERIRSRIEERYLPPINAKARLELANHDPLFYQDPKNHPPFFAEHGVIHHRDVAYQILKVLDSTHGLLIPAREANRLKRSLPRNMPASLQRRLTRPWTPSRRSWKKARIAPGKRSLRRATWVTRCT